MVQDKYTCVVYAWGSQTIIPRCYLEQDSSNALVEDCQQSEDPLVLVSDDAGAPVMLWTFNPREQLMLET